MMSGPPQWSPRPPSAGRSVAAGPFERGLPRSPPSSIPTPTSSGLNSLRVSRADESPRGTVNWSAPSRQAQVLVSSERPVFTHEELAKDLRSGVFNNDNDWSYERKRQILTHRDRLISLRCQALSSIEWEERDRRLVLSEERVAELEANLQAAGAREDDLKERLRIALEEAAKAEEARVKLKIENEILRDWQARGGEENWKGRYEKAQGELDETLDLMQELKQDRKWRQQFEGDMDGVYKLLTGLQERARNETDDSRWLAIQCVMLDQMQGCFEKARPEMNPMYEWPRQGVYTFTYSRTLSGQPRLLDGNKLGADHPWVDKEIERYLGTTTFRSDHARLTKTSQEDLAIWKKKLQTLSEESKREIEMLKRRPPTLATGVQADYDVEARATMTSPSLTPGPTKEDWEREQRKMRTEFETNEGRDREAIERKEWTEWEALLRIERSRAADIRRWEMEDRARRAQLRKTCEEEEAKTRHQIERQEVDERAALSTLYRDSLEDLKKAGKVDGEEREARALLEGEEEVERKALDAEAADSRAKAVDAMDDRIQATMRPTIGVEIKMLDDAGTGKKDCKVVVHSVRSESPCPAMKAGIQPEDILVAWDGSVLDSKACFAKMVSGSKIGREVALTVKRDKGEEQDIKITIAGTLREKSGPRTITTSKTAT